MVRKKSGLILIYLLMVIWVPFSQSAFGDVEFKDLPKVVDSASIGIDQFFFYRVDTNPMFGAQNAFGDDESAFGEIVSTLRATVEKDVGFAQLTSQLAFSYFQTIDADMYGIYKDESEIDVSQAWLKMANINKSGIDLTIGHQDIVIEKAFVMAVGNFQEAAAWALFDKSFPFAMVLDGNFGNFKTNVYWGRTDGYWQNFSEGVKSEVEVAGINLHYDFSEGNYIYGGYIQKIDDLDTPNLTGTITAGNMTQNYDFGFQAAVANLLFEGEINFQSGEAGDMGPIELDRSSWACFLSAKYTFSGKMSPYINATYYYYSGDDDLTDDEVEDYDPMFTGPVAWNRWTIGEIAGELHLPNSNKNAFVIDVGFNPVPTTTVSLMYFNFKLAEEQYLGFPTTSDKWSDEFNLIIDSFPNDHMYIHFGLGYSIPDDAAEEMYGDDDDFFGQILIGFFL